MHIQTIRREPLVKVKTVYAYEVSEYPDEVLIPMDNGHVVRYIRAEPVAEPHFEAAMESVRHMVVGYQYKPKKRRRRL
jgi:hypothetical protein